MQTESFQLASQGGRGVNEHDRVLRDLLLAHIGETWTGREHRVVEEMGLLSHHHRVDVAVLAPERMEAFEIKSDADSLGRLPWQMMAYGALFDRVHIVAGPKHVDRLEAVLPRWWGVMVFIPEHDLLGWRRAPQPNPAVSALAVTMLLWKEEARAMLREFGERPKGARTAFGLQLRLVEAVPHEQLLPAIRQVLMQRPFWREEP